MITTDLYRQLALIEQNYQRYTGELLPVPAGITSRQEWIHQQATYGLLAHNTSSDPVFIYANHHACQSFGYAIKQLLGMPSRFSAAATDQAERQQLLDTVSQRGIAAYSGPRINSQGQTFMLYDGYVWQLYNNGKLYGQAALFHTEKPLP